MNTGPDTAPERKDTFHWVTRETLMARIRNRHDNDSWNEFVRYYEQYVYNVIRSIGLNHHDATEVKQIVMIKLWDIMPDQGENHISGKFRNWLYSVAKNQVKDFIKEHSRRAQRENKAAGEHDYLHTVNVPETDELAEKEWQEHLTQLCWKQVEKDFSPEVIRVFQGVIGNVPVEKVALDNGITESSVYVYKKRVADRLHQVYLELSNYL